MSTSHAPVSTSHLCPPLTCVHLSPVSTSHLSPPLTCVHLSPVSTSHLSPPLTCVHLSPVSTSHLCPPLTCLHLSPVSTSHLCPPLTCLHLSPVSISHLCPPLTCVHLSPVSTSHLFCKHSVDLLERFLLSEQAYWHVLTQHCCLTHLRLLAIRVSLRRGRRNRGTHVSSTRRNTRRQKDVEQVKSIR